MKREYTEVQFRRRRALAREGKVCHQCVVEFGGEIPK